MQRKYILELVRPFVANDSIAEAVVDKLIEEGVINAHFGSQEIGEVIETFKREFGTTTASKYDRFAANRMVGKHGVEQVVGVITALAALQGRQFAPTVNNVSELERKWITCVRFLGNQRTEEVNEL